MDRRATKIPISDQLFHPPSGMCELIVMTDGNFQLFPLCQPDHFFRFFRIQRKGLFDIDMASRFQTDHSQFEMTFWWRSNMNNVGPRNIDKLINIIKMVFDAESFLQLL